MSGVAMLASYLQNVTYYTLLVTISRGDTDVSFTVCATETDGHKSQRQHRKLNRKSENTSQRTKELPATRWFCVVLTGFSNCNYFTLRSYKHVT